MNLRPNRTFEPGHTLRGLREPAPPGYDYSPIRTGRPGSIMRGSGDQQAPRRQPRTITYWRQCNTLAERPITVFPTIW